MIHLSRSRSPNVLYKVIVLLFPVALFLFSRSPVHSQPKQNGEGPNVIVVNVDDFGAELVGCYGSDMYDTPNMDQLAEEGMRFTNAYTTPLCTPSRVQMMSGQYPFRTGWEDGIWKRDHEYVPPETIPMGRMFRNAGYRTAAAGKWQMCRFGRHPDHAEKCGFEATSFWSYRIDLEKYDHTEQIGSGRRPTLPSRYWNPAVWQDGRLLREVDGTYGPDIYNQRLLTFIENQHDRPFFIYYPMVLTHSQFVNPPPAKPSEQNEGNLQTRFKRMVHYTDRLIGRIVNKLKAHDEREETLIIVTGDNGTPQKITSELNGHRIPGGKKKLTEAGSRVPFIASWPGTIPAGTVRHALTDSSDVLPTIAEAAGVRIPEDKILDGRSLLPVLTGKKKSVRDWAFIQLKDSWLLRTRTHRLHEDGRFFDMKDRYDPELLEEPLAEKNRKVRKNLRRIAREHLPERLR